MSTLIEPCIAGCGRSGPVPAGHPALTAYLCPECRAKEVTMTEDTRTQQWVRIEKDRWERVRSAVDSWVPSDTALLQPGDLDPVDPEPTTELTAAEREQLVGAVRAAVWNWCGLGGNWGTFQEVVNMLIEQGWHITRRAE